MYFQDQLCSHLSSILPSPSPLPLLPPQSPASHKGPSLPPLIKIDQSLPGGLPALKHTLPSRSTVRPAHTPPSHSAARPVIPALQVGTLRALGRAQGPSWQVLPVGDLLAVGSFDSRPCTTVLHPVRPIMWPSLFKWPPHYL